MKTYGNGNGNSGVARYDYGQDYIIVEFRDNAAYEYTYGSAGGMNIETMKTLADAGRGLNGFINTTVKYKYSKRIR